MASQEQSYNAEGPTVVAFETLNNNPSNQALGVAVTGSQCGVYGESSPSPLGTRPPKSEVHDGTGVYGRGHVFGVIGDSGSVAGVYGLHEASGAGVIGIGKKNDVTGILGVSKDPCSSAEKKVAPGQGIGVIGASENDEGIGVVGLSVRDLEPTSDIPLFDRRTGNGNGTGVLGASGVGTGVLGMSGSGTGVHGSSDKQHGGVFESLTRAQVHLIPIDIFKLTEKGNPNGAIKGQGGNLLATVDTRERVQRCSLWFCIKGDDTFSPAEWVLIAS